MSNYGFCGECGEHFKSRLVEHISGCDGVRKNYPPLKGVKNGIVAGTLEDFIFQTNRYPTEEDYVDYDL